MSPLSSIAALLFSVLLLIGGNALVGILTPLRARLEGFPEVTIGLLGSAYFAGMLAGTLAAPATAKAWNPPAPSGRKAICPLADAAKLTI